jgi:hypothetical protein
MNQGIVGSLLELNNAIPRPAREVALACPKTTDGQDHRLKAIGSTVPTQPFANAVVCLKIALASVAQCWRRN